MAVFAFGAITAGTLVLGVGRADAVTLVDQESDVDNTGVAVANTGGNVAVGNTSDNRARNDQTARSGAAGDDSVAANIGSTSNKSSGTARIDTGDATAAGNKSATTTSQAASGDSGRRAVVVVDQDSDVDNAGVGVANTGLNAAVGNASDNRARNDQVARSGAADEDSVAVNIGGTSNWSDGTAAISTGDAWAAGNVSDTYVGQLLWADGNGGITVVDQDSDVDNSGLGLANTGLNLAAGNISDNDVDNDQSAIAGAGEDSLAVNIGGTGNWSNGTALIHTGDAHAIGNLSSTTVCQGVNAVPVCPRASVAKPPSVPHGGHDVVKKPSGHAPRHEAMHHHRKHHGVGGADHTRWARAGRGGGRGGGVGGGSLPRTGAPLGAQAAAGLLFLTVGAMARRRAATSS